MVKIKGFYRFFAAIIICLVALSMSGCAMGVAHYTITDPSHLRVLVRNESPYKVKLEGAFTGWLAPYEGIERNMECAGRFEGVAHAYKAIGETDAGDTVLFYMGEQRFSFRTTGYSYYYNGKGYDAVVTISSFYKYPNVIGEKTHYPFYTGPCGLMDLQFQWGK